MTSVDAGSSVRPASPFQSSSSSSDSIHEMFDSISAAQSRIEADRIRAENPGAWTHVKEVFHPTAKKARLKRIDDAKKYDKIMENLYALVAAIYQAMIDPQKESKALDFGTKSSEA